MRRLCFLLLAMGCFEHHVVDHADTGDAFVVPPAGDRCCSRDRDCGRGEVCLGGDGVGECAPEGNDERCWSDESCNAAFTCEGPSVCGHCDGCAVSTERGYCRALTGCAPPTAVVQLGIFHAEPARDLCIELRASMAGPDELEVDAGGLSVSAFAYRGADRCGRDFFDPPDRVGATSGSGRIDVTFPDALVDVSLNFPADAVEGLPAFWEMRGMVELDDDCF